MRIDSPGIVIRDFKLEDNRILTILTKDYGVLTAFANRASRPKSSMAGSTELLCYSDFVLFQNKGKYIVDNADSKHIFFGIRSRYEDLALSSYFAQLMEELAPTHESADAFLQLILNSLHYIEKQERPHKQIKAVFELRLLTLSGYMPDLIGCRVCGEFTGEHMYFSYNGELVCKNCYGQSDPSSLVLVSDGVLAAMRHIIYSEPKKLFNFKLSDSGYSQLAKISENYLLNQIEKTLPTLEFYRSLL